MRCAINIHTPVIAHFGRDVGSVKEERRVLLRDAIVEDLLHLAVQKSGIFPRELGDVYKRQKEMCSALSGACSTGCAAVAAIVDPRV